MKVEFAFQYYQENKAEGESKSTKSEWDTLIMVGEGVLSLHSPAKSEPILLKKYEIGFIPAGMEYERTVLSRATFYCLFFCGQKDHPFYLAAPFGKLPLPQKQAESVLASIRRAGVIPDNTELVTHIVEHTFCENYLFGGDTVERPHVISEKVEDAIRYMREHLSQKIDMDELAAHVFLSHSGLIWKFKKELNTTPSQYLTFLRLNYAKQLLLNYSYSITEISELCGYQNPYYFTNAFRKYAGRSPSEFRKFHFNYRKQTFRG